EDFKNFLSIPRIGIIDTLRIPINKNEYPLDDTIFFYLRYNYNGEEINKKLIVESSTILISDYIFKVKEYGEVVPESLPLSLYFYNSILEQSTLITNNFYPVFIDINLLQSNLASIIINTELLLEDKIKIMEDYV